jgi:hypothetical protein
MGADTLLTHPTARKTLLCHFYKKPWGHFITRDRIASMQLIEIFQDNVFF